VEMLATTYGIRSYVEKEEKIFPVALLILSTPFWIFIIALMYDYAFNIKKAKVSQFDTKTLKQKKNN
jgi:hypothetical protein